MKPQIEMFTFTLAGGQSIGPTSLTALWASACQTPSVSVRRKTPTVGRGDRAVYTLYAAQGLVDMPGVEQRLRDRLELLKLSASIRPLYHR